MNWSSPPPRKPKPPGFVTAADNYLEGRKNDFLKLHVGTEREAALKEYAFDKWLLPGVEGLSNVTAWDMYGINTGFYIHKINGGLMTENEAKRDVRDRAVKIEQEIDGYLNTKLDDKIMEHTFCELIEAANVT